MFDLLINAIFAALFNQALAVKSVVAETNPAICRQLPKSEEKNVLSGPEKIKSDSLGVKISAQSVFAIDEKSGNLLYGKNFQEQRAIASLTKLMTALVFLENNPGMEKEIEITAQDKRDGNKVYFFSGEKVKVKDLFYGMLVASSNEAAAALARSTGLSEKEFISKMNQKAVDIGMKNSIFEDVTGLSSNNKSTAEDVVKMFNSAFSQELIVKAVGTKNYTIENTGRTAVNTDKILGDEFGIDNDSYKIIGGKTGFIELAGYCFVSKIQNSAGEKVIIAVLGSTGTQERFIDTKSIAYWIFNNYKW